MNFTATAFDASGNSWDVTNSTAWNISSGANGSWNNNVYTSATVGVWTVTGTLNGLTNKTTLTVGYSLTFTISISPKNSILTPGSTEAFTATASDIYGNIWDVTNSTTWSIFTNAGGSWVGHSYTASLAGTWIVTGIYRGMSDTASLTVTHGSPVRITVGSTVSSAIAGSNVTYTATAFDSVGNSWDVSNLTLWSSSGANGSWNNNIYYCVTAGNWKIIGNFENLTSTTSLTVTPAAPVNLILSPETSTLTAGSSETFTATANDNFGNNWDVSSSTNWSISSGASGSWSSNVYTSAKASSLGGNRNFGQLIRDGILNSSAWFGNFSNS